MRAQAAGELAHALDRLVAALADDVRRAKVARQCDAVGVTTQEDDLFRAKAAGGTSWVLDFLD